MSATPLGSLFSSLLALGGFGSAAPATDDSGSRRAERAQRRRMLQENLARFPGAAAQMSFRQQIARLDAEDRSDLSGALGAAKYGRSSLRATAGSTLYPSSTSLTSNVKSSPSYTSLTSSVKSSPSIPAGSLTSNTKSSSSPSSYAAESSANASEEFDLDASVTDYPAQIEELKARLQAEKNAAKRQRIMTRLRQLQRALARSRATGGGGRRMPRTEGAAMPRVTTEQLEQKLQELIGRRDKLARRFKGAKGGKRSDLQNRIQGLSKRINDLRERIDRLDSLPAGQRGAEVRAISSGLSEGATMARTLEADPTLRYGLEAEDVTTDSTDAPAEETAITPAADTVTADQPWYKRHAIPLTLAGATVAIVGTLLLTRKK